MAHGNDPPIEEGDDMCGRFVRAKAAESYGDFFGVPDVPKLFASYNVAPTQEVLAIRVQDGAKKAVALRWGLIPAWAKDKKTLLINARAETIAEKPAYRVAFKKRRCLIVADAYYEWKKLGPKEKQPFLFRLKNGDPFGFAGIWETWEAGSEAVESCAIVTTEANELSRPVHDRMPVILRGADADMWLNLGTEDAKALTSLLRPLPAGEMVTFPVSARVGKVSENDAGLIEPA
jgi:putative SOS response-associated peptidase YedK